PGKRSAFNTLKDVPSVDQGQSQLNNGDFAAAVDTFTQIIATNPQNSLVYRLRGDAYDNLGDQEKALEDWTEAARLGDTVIQSSLDSQGVKWREKPAP
ncbi:MAG TPA: tetratricopeptide repeat protein, partial [Geobacteraceae bacterium]|nr:tetratricopeptide repeat protein [Geobacteraceae bacterium]